MPPNPIDARTQLVGLIGWPVAHSVSPAMHNAAFVELGLNWRYVPLPVPPGHLEAAVRGLVALGFRGANVTVPHKQATLHALQAPILSSNPTGQSPGDSALASDAGALGAVNTIVVRRGEDKSRVEGEGHDETGGEERGIVVRGYNTDATGFAGALEHGGFRPEGASAVVVGAGGAARAVVWGLAEAGAASMTVLNRTPDRAENLVADLRAALHDPPPPEIQACPLTRDSLIDATRAAQLLVNATPVGMWPSLDGSIWPDRVPMPSDLTVFDLVYNPLETRLQRQAGASGARAIGGLDMLVRQGALALELWTGCDAPYQIMRIACQRALEAQDRS